MHRGKRTLTDRSVVRDSVNMHITV